MTPRFFSPAETARRLKVSTKALRLYETLGLVKPVRTGVGWRTYGPEQMVRLHQVLALKFLGVPLKRVGDLLGDPLADLDAVLLLQEEGFRARIADDARRLELLVAVRRRLARGETLSVDDLIHLTRETVMTDPLEGQLAAAHLRVGDRRRAAAYFGELFGWTFAEGGEGSAWSVTAAGIADRPWALAITDAADAPSVRLGFEVADPDEALARARSLGGAGASPEASIDDQGLPLAFFARGAATPHANDRATGELGVAVAMVGDTGKAKAFYSALFGDGFHQIGPKDRWWSTRAAFGIFSDALGVSSNERVAGLDANDAPDVHVFVCVRDLDGHKDRVRALGGAILTESAMGPYQVCACRDDQGTGFHLWQDPARE